MKEHFFENTSQSRSKNTIRPCSVVRQTCRGLGGVQDVFKMKIISKEQIKIWKWVCSDLSSKGQTPPLLSFLPFLPSPFIMFTALTRPPQPLSIKYTVNHQILSFPFPCYSLFLVCHPFLFVYLSLVMWCVVSVFSGLQLHIWTHSVLCVVSCCCSCCNVMW